MCWMRGVQMGCLVGSWPPGEKSRYRFINQQCEAWDGMRIRGTVLVDREETTYTEIILGFRIQGEAWRESLGAPEKEASERKKSRWKSRLLECPRVRQKPGLVGASGQLWGTACAGSGVSGGRLVSSDRASAVNTNRRLEEHVPRPRPSQWKGGLPLSRSLGQAPFIHDSLPSAEAAAVCSASSFSDWQRPLGPVLLRAWTAPPPQPRLSLRLPALGQNPEWVTLSPLPLLRLFQIWCQAHSPCAFLHWMIVH